LGNTLDPEWPKVEVKYHGEKISRPGILLRDKRISRGDTTLY
jgi:hypothetical protein